MDRFLYKLLDSNKPALRNVDLDVYCLASLRGGNHYGLAWLVANRFWSMGKTMQIYSSSPVQVSPCKEYTDDSRLSLPVNPLKKRRGVNHLLWFQGYSRLSFCRLASLEYKPFFSISSLCLPSCNTIQTKIRYFRLLPIIMGPFIFKRSQRCYEFALWSNDTALKHTSTILPFSITIILSAVWIVDSLNRKKRTNTPIIWCVQKSR